MADPETKPNEPTEEEEVEDVEDAEDEEEVKGSAATFGLASQLMQNPQMLAAMQDRLGSLVGQNSGYVQSLPKSVKRRIKALKKVQFEATKIEADFYKEVHELECKYAAKYGPLFEKRKQVVTGTTEPTDEECDWPSDDEKEELSVHEGADIKGIPNFWLTIFKNVDMLSEMVQDHDEPILQSLQDIKVKFLEPSEMGFTLECQIDWKKGKNVTVKSIKKKQKHKGRGTTRTVTKTVQNDSFFNFFNPPDEDLEALLSADFEIGHFIRERIVPRAVLYFTGEALETDEFEEEGEDEEGGEEADYDEDADPDYNPQADPKAPSECKQQYEHQNVKIRIVNNAVRIFRKFMICCVECEHQKWNSIQIIYTYKPFMF
ncbi:hypothetical protein KUTeg_023745 [Tegillarca granosa]|uniref:Nucleosome assembly protein 1-like 1 n=1 Tax=Tegillarca granosa TaxID=220873 RepID=A0ABQ9E850_TEGGR|nr:hypothetical protein KUTeg_023745 [Tegillarca granosa]